MSYNLYTDIALDAEQWSAIIDDPNVFFDRIFQRTLSHINFPTTAELELSLVLTNDKNMQKINYTHRGKNNPTNVLSFPQEEFTAGDYAHIGDTPLCLGDIVIAYETVEREAKEEGKSFLAHTNHMAVHGLLHLLGYDHIEDSEAEVMEALENDILKLVGV